MLGIASYDSDEEPPAAPAAEAVPAAAEPPAKRQRTEEPAADLAPKTLARPELPTRVREQKLREIKREISLAKSATAVVQVVRQNLKDCWDARWGAEALYQVAKRSTARTRQEWAEDKAVLKLAEKLQEDAASGNDADIILLSMEALRRMTIQESQDQKSIIEHLVSLMLSRSWRSPAKSLARLFWLGAPLKSEGSLKEHFASKALPSLLRSKQMDLDGPDLALILAAMKGEKGVKDTALQSKVVLRLKEKGIHRGLSATDIVEMAECLQDLGVQDQAALRPLGQEGLRRRGELTPDESHRIHTAFQAMKQPLPQVWDKPGSTKTKQTENGKVTTQAFALQEGHEKKRHGNNDIQRTSPPRVVRDMKMCSY